MNIRHFSFCALAACSSPSAEIGQGYTRALHTMPIMPNKLDVLFVVDDSPSIADDQADLVAAARDQLFPQLVLPDGELVDLHVGVVSTSMDVTPNETSGCGGTPNGKLLTGPWTTDAPCPGIDGTFLIDSPDGMGGRTTNFTGALDDNFACIATIGYNGCGFEQPLAAMQEALGGTHPENTGFLRDDALLLVVILSDEDDNSGTSPDDWVLPDPFEPNVREFEYGVQCDPDDASLGPRTGCVPRASSTAVTPIDGFVTFLQGLKSDPSYVLVAGIVSPPGPVNVIPYAQGSDQVTLDVACTPPGRSGVLPAVRTNAFLADFPGRYVLAPFCADTMDAHVHTIARAVHGVMTNSPCVLDDLPEDPASRCRAFDVAPDGTRTDARVTFTTDATTCGYTPTQVRADVDVAAGHGVDVECLR